MSSFRPPRRWLAACPWLVLGVAAAFLSVSADAQTSARPSASAQTPPTPEGAITAADILRTVREAQGSRHDALDGQLRDDIAGLTFPFRLVSDGTQVRYEFKGPPPTAVQVHYNEDGSELVESGPEGSGKLTPANFDKHILGSDLTYEDLALRFLYWTRAVIEGEDSIKTRSAWKLRLTPPNHHTQYGSVVVWVDKESGALLRVDGFDGQGKLSKRFEVISVQKINGRTYLKQMRIEGFDPATGHTRSRTYLEIKGAAK